VRCRALILSGEIILNSPDLRSISTASISTRRSGLFFLIIEVKFSGITPQGASPVSISGIAYDLITAMIPAPDQIIALSVDEDAAQAILDEEGIEQVNGDPEGTLPDFKLGDILPVKTGIIVDH